MTVEEALRELHSNTIIEVTVPKARVLPGEFLFKMHDTHGIPLCMSLMMVQDYKLLVNWKGWIEAGKKAGWPLKKILTEIIYACRDSGYGGDYIKATFPYKEIEKKERKEEKEGEK